MSDSKEKREFFRMQVDCDIHRREEGHKESIYLGRCTTLSGAGVSFISSFNVNIGDFLDVIINPQQKLTPPITGKATIIRIVVLDNDEFEIGATLDISNSES